MNLIKLIFAITAVGCFLPAGFAQIQSNKPVQWFFEGCNAPTAFNYKDSVLYFAGDPAGFNENGISEKTAIVKVD